MEDVSNSSNTAAVLQLMEWKRYKEALVEVEQVLALNPEDPDLLALVANIHFLMNEYEKALYWSTEALQRDPNQELAWYVRVGVYYETGNDKAFNQALPEAMRIDPYEPHYYFLKANKLNKKGKFKESREQMLHALELRPDSQLYLAMMSYIEALLGNIAESSRLDRQAIQYDAEMPYVLLYLAWSAGHRGDYKLKETYMRNAVRLNPEDKQIQDEYLEALQHSHKLFRMFLWPSKMINKMQKWHIIVAWIVVWILFRPLIILFILLYVLTHWVTKGIVHVRVFGWRRRSS